MSLIYYYDKHENTTQIKIDDKFKLFLYKINYQLIDDDFFVPNEKLSIEKNMSFDQYMSKIISLEELRYFFIKNSDISLYSIESKYSIESSYKFKIMLNSINNNIIKKLLERIIELGHDNIKKIVGNDTITMQIIIFDKQHVSIDCIKLDFTTSFLNFIFQPYDKIEIIKINGVLNDNFSKL
jgi:hypothetical protein